MEISKIFYGDEVVNVKELVESDVKRFIKLEYYEIEQKMDNEIGYGIEVKKKEYMNSKILEETEKVEYITEDKNEIDSLISIIKRNKVTPVLLGDIVNDLIKTE